MENLGQASHAELEIMKIIWQSGNEITVGALLDKLSAIDKSWKSSTVVTFLYRLTEKGLLKPVKKGRNNLYFATMTEAEFLERQTQSFIAKNYGGSAKELVASLMKQQRLTSQDMEELNKFWQEGGGVDE